MSIASVVTRGYVDSIQSVVTHGYFIGLEPVGGRVLTEEEAEALDAFGRARDGITDSQEIHDKLFVPDTPEKSILPERVELSDIDVVPLSEVVLEIPTPLQEKIEPIEDIWLILAMIEAHDN